EKHITDRKGQDCTPIQGQSSAPIDTYNSQFCAICELPRHPLPFFAPNAHPIRELKRQLIHIA
ncbi:MAG: hypothetical protein K2X43_18805, partial [Hyphomonadaceae bacterium]|nr:hypothetical protein [Hyphomonadaceae bacterium]